MYIGRYVKDAIRSVDTEDRCYKKSFVSKQVSLGINFVFGYLYNPTYVGPTCVRTYVRVPMLRKKPCRRT